MTDTTMPASSVEGLAQPISRLVLGTMTFGDTADVAESAAMIDAALDAGVTMIDTANGYAGGTTESLLGEVLPGRRGRFSLATKAGIPHPDAGEHSPLSAAGIRASVEGSLQRLGVDHVALLYLHQPDRAARLDETLGAVAELVAEGKVGALGVSNFAAWQVSDVARVAAEVGAPRPVVAQQLYNLLARRIEDEYVEFADVHDVHTMVYNPLAGGLLTGRHRRDDAPASGRYGDSRVASMYRDRYWTDALFAGVERLQAIAEEAGMPLVELAFRWLLSRPVVGSVLVGGSRRSQLEQNLAFASADRLDDAVLTACDAVGADLVSPMPPYNR